jgi:hypothetical protein
VRGAGALEWVRTLDLKAGDRLVTANGRGATVRAVTLRDGFVQTTNLEVADFHTFLVGDNGVVVHNGCPPLGPHKGLRAWLNRLWAGNWSSSAISSTIRYGQSYGVVNNVNKGAGAKVYLEPGGTGRFVVVDSSTGNILQVSRPGQIPPPRLP